MKITENNIDDIIRQEKTKLRIKGEDPNNYLFKWGKEGFEALSKYFGYLVCRNENRKLELHDIFCECEGAKLEEKDKNLRLLGVNHTWDKRRKDFELVRIKL